MATTSSTPILTVTSSFRGGSQQGPVHIQVQSPWFEHIRDGKKTLEGRLNKGKFAEICKGTTLVVKHASSSSLTGNFAPLTLAVCRGRSRSPATCGRQAVRGIAGTACPLLRFRPSASSLLGLALLKLLQHLCHGFGRSHDMYRCGGGRHGG